METFVNGISKELSKNAEVHVVTLDEKEHTYTKDGVVFHTFSLQTRKAKILSTIFCRFSEENKDLIYVTFKILSLLKDIEKKYGSIDCIHAHHFNTCIAPIFYRKIFQKKIPLLLHYHNLPKLNGTNKWVAEEYNLLLVVSNFVKKYVVDNLGIKIEKVRVIYNAIDIAEFEFDALGAEEIRKKWCLDKNPVLLFVGRIVPEKGLQELLKIFPIVQVRFPNVKLLVVGPLGDFSGKNYNQPLANALKIADSVIYLGQLTLKELIKVYSAADVCIVPSIWEEPFGLVVVEAMACSKPVVAFSVGGIPEIITSGFDGFLVDKRNDCDLVYRIMCLLSNSYLREKIGLNAKETAREKFNYKNLVANLNDIYTLSNPDQNCRAHS